MARGPEPGWARSSIVIPFAVLAIGWGANGQWKVAQLEAAKEQRAELADRRSREIDALNRCTERQIDLVRHCARCE